MATGRTLLVRRPSPRLAAGELTHLARRPIDAELARRQWAGYVDVFARHGWRVVEVEPADEHPDGVFVEDAVVVFDDLAVLCRPGAASRAGEVTSVDRALRTAVPELDRGRIEPPGHLDGGDVLKVGRTAYVGLSSRTNAAGLAQLRTVLEPRGWTVVGVPVARALHLKSAVTALPDGTVIGWPAVVDDASAFGDVLAVPEEPGHAVVDLGGGAVVLSAAAPRTAGLLRERGLAVEMVDLTELEKLEGCVTCLSVRVRADSAR